MSRFNEHGLTPQQEAFAVAVAAGSNLSDAYRKAYPRSLKWTPETVHEKASRMAANAKVSTRVRSLQSAVAEESILKAADILNEARRVATSSVSAFFWPDGAVKRPHELDADAAACVASFDILPDGTVKYRLWDKNSATSLAARILGLLEKDNKQKTDPLQSLLDSLSGNVIGPKPEDGMRHNTENTE